MAKCPRCNHLVHFYDAQMESLNGTPVRGSGVVSINDDERVGVLFLTCPNCERLVVKAVINKDNEELERYVWPPAPMRAVSSEVPAHIASDFNEAVEVLPLSAKASAALSRRCLQTILREAGGCQKRDLSDQIEEIMPKLPTTLQGSVDAVRNIGNFAAHLAKSTSTGTIIEVEPGEAEWNIEILEELFDFFYIQPARIRMRRDALNRKLLDANKPPMK